MESKNILNNDCIHVNNLINNESKLDREFYSTNAVQLARNLLGKIIVRKLGNVTVKCRIVETEAYMGPFDKGAHSYNNKKTERTKYFWQTGGCLYVYSIHQSVCMNIVANDKDKPEAVLIRAVEPLSGIEKIKENRKDLKSSKRPKDLINLTNGPGKVCAALNITKSFNALDTCNSEELYLIDDMEYEVKVERSTRININYAEEFRFKPWRFFIKNNIFVSKAKVEHKYLDE